MTTLKKLIHKKNKIIIGLMSGTSVDGIDAAIVSIKGSGVKTKFKLIKFKTFSYPKNFKEVVLANSHPGKGSVDMISTLNFAIAEYFTLAVKKIVLSAKLKLNQIDLIGSHGQTIHHIPNGKIIIGKNFSSTLQIGDPSVIAKLTGITTIGDFRVADVALGGQGAPLVPYFDWLVFRSRKKNRALLNIGGIANLTLLPKNVALKNVLAFDSGPGNMLIDRLMKIFYKKDFDKNGAVARSGFIINPLLSELKKHNYFKKQLPKSTGREEFGEKILNQIIKSSKGYSREDIIATATELTAFSIFEQCKIFYKNFSSINELIVSGGGANNLYLIERLKFYFDKTKIKYSNSFGVDKNAKEAICFALLANETISGIASNIPKVTGAKRFTILGKICL
ncbi:MAG: anhydro-N-acetylmuramic acid kinase [Bacteroidetes bacterium]|nr:anhydro-N-acetylmuramic acid kinase [Bacteroidota bacterium]